MITAKHLKEIGAHLAESAKRDDGKLFVMQWEDEWQIHLEKEDEPLKIFKTNRAAVRNALNYLKTGVGKRIVIANNRGQISYL